MKDLTIRYDILPDIAGPAPTGDAWKDRHNAQFLSWCYSLKISPNLPAIERYVDELAELAAPSTLNVKLCALKSGYLNAFWNAHLPTGDLEAAFRRLRRKIPKEVKDRPRSLSDDEFERMTKNLPPKRKAFMLALWETGARVSEMCEARRDAIQEKDGVSWITLRGKGNKIRTVPLSASLVKEIDSACGERRRKWLFPARKKGAAHTGRNTAYRWVAEAAESIGIKAHPHMLRHSYATRLIEAGIALPHVQRLLGHAKMDTTMIYVHADIPVSDVLAAARSKKNSKRGVKN